MTPGYLELLSPVPILVKGVGHAVSPTLREIARIGQEEYSRFLGLLSTDMPFFLERTGLSAVFFNLSDTEQKALTLFDLLILNPVTRETLQKLFSFFFREQARFEEEENAYLLQPEGADGAPGKITRSNYEEVRAILLRLNYLSPPNMAAAKNPRAQKILEKIQRGKEQQSARRKKDLDLSIGNMVSALAAQHNSLNMLNIWDLTVYQLYDQFFRQGSKNQLDIHALNYAVWGGEFDPASWFKALNK